jgi:hypothetical protein
MPGNSGSNLSKLIDNCIEATEHLANEVCRITDKVPKKAQPVVALCLLGILSLAMNNRLLGDKKSPRRKSSQPKI